VKIESKFPLNERIRPLIFWEGFPVCGLLIKQVADLYGDQLIILGTPPAVPFERLEDILGHAIQWLDHPDDIWRRREEFADRNLVIHTGWAHKGWLQFDRWIKQRGARVVVTVDNRWKGSLRQYAGALWFRVWLRRHFDAALVPGRSATQLMRFLGMPAERIFTGYYGAYEGIYQAGPALNDRPKEFLFVGQLIERKGLDILLRAYKAYREAGGDWKLRVIGNGPLASLCVGNGVVLEDFMQPEAIVRSMHAARCLVLPSREDHWGTVVCEAMACGMAVIVSKWVGASEDLVRPGVNGWEFQEMNPSSLADKMVNVSQWSNDMLSRAEAVSLGLAVGYQSASYATAFENLTRLESL
jgi:glycosyltransferase involved in cell wall biosynthesis